MTSRRTIHVEHVVTSNTSALLGFFLRRIDNPFDAADLVSETVLAVWKAAKRMPSDDAGARMWLFGVARNVLMHHGRTTVRRDSLTTRLADAISASPTLMANEDVMDVRAAVDALPADLAELIRLVHWDGFSIADAATHLGVSASTLRSRHARAKQLLQEALVESSVGTVGRSNATDREQGS